MVRLVKPLETSAVAALAAVTALLVAGVFPVQAQDGPLPVAREKPAEVVVPGAGRRQDLIRDIDSRRKARVEAVDAVEKAALRPRANPIPGLIVNPAARPALDQFRPVFQRELRLLTTVANPSPEERKEIALEAGRTLREELETLSRNPQKLDAALADPRRLVRGHLQLAVWSKLNNVQSARYRSELDRKERDRREVVVVNVVAKLDERLHLDDRQREKLSESLRSHWDDRDYPAVETSIAYDLYIPIIADAYVVPILDESQQKIWRASRKYHFSALKGGDPIEKALLLPVEDDDPDEDDDVKAAFAPGVKK